MGTITVCLSVCRATPLCQNCYIYIGLTEVHSSFGSAVIRVFFGTKRLSKIRMHTIYGNVIRQQGNGLHSSSIDLPSVSNWASCIEWCSWIATPADDSSLWNNSRFPEMSLYYRRLLALGYSPTCYRIAAHWLAFRYIFCPQQIWKRLSKAVELVFVYNSLVCYHITVGTYCFGALLRPAPIVSIDLHNVSSVCPAPQFRPSITGVCPLTDHVT